MKLTKLILITIVTLITMKAYAYEYVVSAKEVKEKISSIKGENIVVLLDIDDTIITPKSLTFRNSPYNKIIDHIKANSEQYPNYEEIVSNWRLQRKAILINQEWPEIINSLKSKYRVFGLTKVNTGKFGHIKSMEQWRYNELLSLGIILSEHEEQPKNKTNNTPFFLHGIMMTGSDSKANTLKKYISVIGDVDTIVFVDDRKKNLQEIESFCKQHNINFVGLYYHGIQKLSGKQDEQIYLLQKSTLINKAKWLSDEEAKSVIKAKTSNKKSNTS